VLCSKCYKKIPEGEEVAKSPSLWSPKSKWWEGNEIYCKRCAVRQDRNDRLVLIFFFSILFMGLLIIFINSLFTKKNQEVFNFISLLIMSFATVVFFSILLFLSFKSRKKDSRLIRKNYDIKKLNLKTLEKELINELQENENFCRKIIKNSKIKSSLIEEKLSPKRISEQVVVNSRKEEIIRKEKRIEELLEEIEQKRKDCDWEMKLIRKTNDKLEDIFTDIQKALREIKSLKEEIEELKKTSS